MSVASSGQPIVTKASEVTRPGVPLPQSASAERPLPTAQRTQSAAPRRMPIIVMPPGIRKYRKPERIEEKNTQSANLLFRPFFCFHVYQVAPMSVFDIININNISVN